MIGLAGGMRTQKSPSIADMARKHALEERYECSAKIENQNRNAKYMAKCEDAQISEGRQGRTGKRRSRTVRRVSALVLTY